ncbi:unnamed protein product [Candida verbasci]|uniref:Ebp2p n=1 Tax=Candida verbasci TaxID=1227364 RepID=A0A9W4TUC9_9ASCO|nr:unnamed protein product [Candida verbasci]
MGRGTLKQQLKHHQAKENQDKIKTKTNDKPKKQEIQEEEPIIIEKPIVKSPKSNKSKSKTEDDYQSATLSKKEQRKLKKLQAKAEPEQEEEGDEEIDELDEEDDDEEDEGLDLEKLAASESESELESEDDDEESEDDDEDEDEELDVEEEEEEEEVAEDIPLSDVEVDSDADIVPHTKLTINNTAALRDSLARIELPWSSHSFIEHQSIISAEKSEIQIKDIYDDTERELSFYKQGLDAVKQARSSLLKLKVPFSRPIDYFAEMVKSDEHMDKLKQKLLTEAANKKASEDAKKQRQLKKFGKQVEHETLQKRAKEKRETLDKIKSLKKKRGANEISNDDDFQIALEEATKENERDSKRKKPNSKRLAKNAKYGNGGMKRGNRKNDAQSSGDIREFSSKKMKGKQPSRPGKSKRRH